jgi:hypothetical protein
MAFEPNWGEAKYSQCSVERRRWLKLLFLSVCIPFPRKATIRLDLIGLGERKTIVISVIDFEFIVIRFI